MRNQKLYGKTLRIGVDNVYITEKLDGSNLGFFRLGDTLVVAQRNWVFEYTSKEELEQKFSDTYKQKLYPNLYQYLLEYGDIVLNSLYDGSGVFGEWMGQGSIKNYDQTVEERYKPTRFNIFAKARIRVSDKGNYVIENLVYSHDLLPYAFIGDIPFYFSYVPLIDTLDNIPTIDELDTLYKIYSTTVGRDVEGFVISYLENPRKYVRMKGGQLRDHTYRKD